MLFCESVENSDRAILACWLHRRAIWHSDGACFWCISASSLGVVAIVVVIVNGFRAFPCPKQHSCCAREGGCRVEASIIIPLVVFGQVVEPEIRVADVTREAFLFHHIITDAAVVDGIAWWISDVDYLMVDAPVEVITVQKEEKANQNDLMALNIGDFPEDKVEENEQAKDFLIYGDFKTKFYKVIWDTFKYNAMVFFSFLIPTIGVIAFLLLCPLYFQTNNKLLLIPFVITISICFVLYMLMTYKCTTFAPGKADANKGKKRITFSIINTIVTLIGIGLGIVIYVLFKNYDSELKALPFNKTGVILAVVFSVILITACLYLSPILNAIFGLFRKLFSKEKGTKK